jgi:hypothetical protein
MLEGLVLDINVFGLGPFSDPITVLPVFRAVFGNVNTEKNLAATRILAFLFTQFLAPSRLG